MRATTQAQDRLFSTAARLFYQSGYHVTGVDTIAAESGVGKMTLYRHYPTKADLIVAFLQDSDEVFWEHFGEVTAQAADGRAALLEFFSALQEYVLSPACYGCPFINAAVEYPDDVSAIHQSALAHKRGVLARFAQIARAAGARQPERLAGALLLLLDGAYVAARMFGTGDDSPAHALAESARVIVDACW